MSNADFSMKPKRGISHFFLLGAALTLMALSPSGLAADDDAELDSNWQDAPVQGMDNDYGIAPESPAIFEIQEIIREFNSNNDAYGFKRVIYLFRGLGLEKKNAVLSHDQVMQFLHEKFGNQLDSDENLSKFFSQIGSIMTTSSMVSGGEVTSIRIATAGGAPIELKVKPKSKNDPQVKLTFNNGVNIQIFRPTVLTMLNYLRRPDSGSLGIAIAKWWDDDAKEFFSDRDIIMSLLRANLANSLGDALKRSKLEPLYLSARGASVSINGHGLNMEEALIVPGLFLQFPPCPECNANEHWEPNWHLAQDDPAFFWAEASAWGVTAHIGAPF